MDRLTAFSWVVLVLSWERRNTHSAPKGLVIDLGGIAGVRESRVLFQDCDPRGKGVEWFCARFPCRSGTHTMRLLPCICTLVRLDNMKKESGHHPSRRPIGPGPGEEAGAGGYRKHVLQGSVWARGEVPRLPLSGGEDARVGVCHQLT